MGEKFDTPTGVMSGGTPAGTSGQSQGLAVDMSASSERTTTQEKPGTGTKDSGSRSSTSTAPEGKSGWEGAALYPDGYKMARLEDGLIYLQTPGEEFGIWDHDGKQWVDPTTKQPMPEGWGGGHEPGKH